MARYSDNSGMIALQAQALKDQRERDQRAAVASGNVDENSALYRHAKLNGWDLGGKDELHGPARANAVARDAAATDIVEQRAAGAPRSPISMFAADGDGNFSFYNEDNALRAGFDGIMANANAQKADRARRGRATLGSMVGHAMDNGGMVPRELGAAYGQELGQNGPMFGTLAKDGTFISLGIGQDGKMQPTGLVRSFDVLGSMVQSGDWKNAQKYAKKYLDGKYTPEQIAGATGFSPQWARGAATNEISAADKKLQLEAMKVLLDMDKANKTPVTAEDFYRNNPRLITMLGTDYQRDKNGQVVMDEMTGKPVEIALPPEEISKRAVAFFDGLRKSEANGGGTGMNEIQRAIVDGIRALTTPPAAQPTANVPQRGFYYRNRSGGLTATNGYVVGGKAYDRYGNVMQGVQPLDYQGNPISGDAPDDAVVSTPAPAQQQSQATRQSDNGDTHTDERGTWQAVRDANGNIIGKKLISKPAAQPEQQQSAPLSQPVTSLESPAPAQGQYGLRNDGKTHKGTGWLGELKLPNGGVATEYSVGVNIGGKEMDIPTLVPGLSQEQISRMVNDIIPNNKDVPKDILDIAAAHAKSQLAKGESVWANESAQPTQQSKEKTPQDHISLILRDRRLSPKEKEARIAYWRRIQQRNAEKSAAELGVDVNDDLAMLEAELNGPSETMIASN